MIRAIVTLVLSISICDCVSQTKETFEGIVEYLNSSKSDADLSGSQHNIIVNNIYSENLSTNSDNRLEINELYNISQPHDKFVAVTWGREIYLMENHDFTPLIYLLSDVSSQSTSLINEAEFVVILNKLRQMYDFRISQYGGLYFSENIYRFMSDNLRPADLKEENFSSFVSSRPLRAFPQKEIYDIIAADIKFKGFYGDSNPENNLDVKVMELPDSTRLKLYRITMRGHHINSDNDMFHLLIDFNGRYYLCDNGDLNSWPILLLDIHNNCKETISDEDFCTIIKSVIGTDTYLFWNDYDGINCSTKLIFHTFHPNIKIR